MVVAEERIEVAVLHLVLLERDRGLCGCCFVVWSVALRSVVLASYCKCLLVNTAHHNAIQIYFMSVLYTESVTFHAC